MQLKRKICLSSFTMLTLLLALAIPVKVLCQRKIAKAAPLVITNFDTQGNQVIRYNNVGDAVDAHDGEIALFNGTYYLYGTSYDCGFEWGNKNAPFCGFKTYSSPDMVNWTDRGFLFDAKTDVWQTRCNGNTYGCFRPHVVFNSKTKLYVLWINVYDNVSGYRVFTSKTPVGPFIEQAEPKMAVNAGAPKASLNNGDHDTFIDDDDTAYLAYTDWRTDGTIVIEKLSADYLTGTGKVVRSVTAGRTEAPGMFKRNGIYYVLYSDPNCGYCSGTGTSYKTAPSPLGPWSEGKKISDNSCGGQPSFVSTIKLSGGTVFLFGSDLWNNAAKNEALANYYWAPLTFNADGSIIPMTCDQPFKVTRGRVQTIPATNAGYSFKGACDIKEGVKRIQTFKANKTGTLKSISFGAFKSGNPEGNLQLYISYADANGRPVGDVLTIRNVSAKTIGWSVKRQTVAVNIRVIKGQSVRVVFLGSNTGCYGLTYRHPSTQGVVYGKLSGDMITPDSGKELDFSVIIK